MARIPTPIEPIDAAELEFIDDVEELGADAIIAQQTTAHLPQKRVNVQSDPRSIVIAEEPTPSSRRPGPYGADRGAATLVMRDRRELEAMRRKVVLERSKAKRSAFPYVWAGLAVAAFAAGGLVTLLLVRGSAPAPSLGAATPAVEADAVRRADSRAVIRQQGEAHAPAVKLEELPVERPPTRSTVP